VTHRRSSSELIRLDVLLERREEGPSFRAQRRAELALPLISVPVLPLSSPPHPSVITLQLLEGFDFFLNLSTRRVSRWDRSELHSTSSPALKSLVPLSLLVAGSEVEARSHGSSLSAYALEAVSFLDPLLSKALESLELLGKTERVGSD